MTDAEQKLLDAMKKHNLTNREWEALVVADKAAG